MKNTAEEIILELKDFFKKKSSQYGVDMAFLYGSWATGYPHRESDIDLAIVFSSSIRQEEFFQLITDISYELSTSLNQEVNVIPVFEDFRKPMLYYNAIVLGKPLFIRDEKRYLDLKISAIFQMEDFCIFGIPWQLEIARENMRR